MNKAWRATYFLSAYFFAFGIQLPYFPLWLEEVRGLSGEDISLVLSGALIGRIITGPLIAAWADNKSGNVAALILNLAALFGFGMISQIDHPIGLMFAGFFALTLIYAIAPVAEAILLRSALAAKSPTYTTGRAIASTSFVVGVFLGGWVVDRWGAVGILPSLLVWYLVSSVIALSLPREAMGSFSGGGFLKRLEKSSIFIRRPALFFLLIATGLIQAAHSFYYGFSAIIWKEQAFSGSLVSLFWIVGVLFEIILFFFAARLPAWVTPQRLILAGAIASVVRWGGLGYAPTSIFAIMALQLLHALTFAATYLGTIRVIERDVPPDDRASVLSVLAAITTGVITGSIGIIAGRLYDDFNEKVYWLMAGISAVGVLFAILLMIRVATRPPRN